MPLPPNQLFSIITIETTILTTCKHTIDANLIKARLENHGIKSFLNNEHFADLMPQYYGIFGSGVQVVVRKEDYLRAKEVIDIGESKITCPNCSSDNITEAINQNKIVMLIALIFGGPIGNLLGNYWCKECGTEFRK